MSTRGMVKIVANGLGHDELLYQLVQMAHNLLDYVSLDQALSSGDVGHLKDMLPHLLYRFVGGGCRDSLLKSERVKDTRGLEGSGG